MVHLERKFSVDFDNLELCQTIWQGEDELRHAVPNRTVTAGDSPNGPAVDESDKSNHGTIWKSSDQGKRRT